MENAGQNRTPSGVCPTCGQKTRKRKPPERLWKPGVGSVRKCDRVGFTAADVRMALYQCKYAQWKQQEGQCGVCNEPMDPKYAVWIAAKWLDGTGLAKWALGRELVFNGASEEFDAVPRSPAEIRDEYREGLNGHYLWHRRCRVKFRKVGAGIPTRGPAHIREYGKLVALGIPTNEAVVRADDILREQSRVRMEEARSHKKSKRRTWSHDEKAERRAAGQRESGWDAEPPGSYTSRISRKRRRQRRHANVSKPGAPVAVPHQPDPTGDNLRAAQEEAESRPMTDLERACYEGTPEERLGGILDRLADAWRP